ncbi:MAG: hypothetical protein CL946_06265 [Ectothiorhodospiraceae bacterium]|nr:hypothetical protein [Ectothiorhodospiraceae bacterium]
MRLRNTTITEDATADYDPEATAEELMESALNEYTDIRDDRPTDAIDLIGADDARLIQQLPDQSVNQINLCKQRLYSATEIVEMIRVLKVSGAQSVRISNCELTRAKGERVNYDGFREFADKLGPGQYGLVSFAPGNGHYMMNSYHCPTTKAIQRKYTRPNMRRVGYDLYLVWPKSKKEIAGEGDNE